jgi:hypothetical protein
MGWTPPRAAVRAPDATDTPSRDDYIQWWLAGRQAVLGVALARVVIESEKSQGRYSAQYPRITQNALALACAFLFDFIAWMWMLPDYLQALS